jgi:hypothetical protein
VTLTKEILKELNNTFLILLKNNIILDYNPPIERNIKGKNIITWSNAPVSIFEILRENFGSINEYLFLLHNGHYNCILFDGSMIQCGYILQDENIISHRNCYYPCPVKMHEGIQQGHLDELIITIDSLLETNLLITEYTNEQNYRFSDNIRPLSPIRFDFKNNINNKDHPNSHLTMLDENCRLPVFGPISVSGFFCFIFKHFYPLIWNSNSEIRTLALKSFSRTIKPEEERELHLDCRFP